MKTQLAPARTLYEIEHAVEAAVYLLSAGHVVALPTETVYGLAGWALNSDALFRIFQAKDRPLFDPLILHLPSRDWVHNICDIPFADRKLADALMTRFWPGPLTFIFPRKKVVPDLATSGLDTVAVRMSANPIFDAVVQSFGQPLAAPSANRFGRISPTTGPHVVEELNGKIHLVVDGGPTMHGVESTIIALRDGEIWVFRQGPITVEDLQTVAPVKIAPRSPNPRAPGQLKSHYAPRTPLRLLPVDAPLKHTGPERAGLLAWCDNESAQGYAAVETLSKRGDSREAAETLFAKLRRLDAAGVDVIYAEQVPGERIGAAIQDRLRKAAGLG